MAAPNKLFGGRKRSETTGSVSSARESSNRLSFGGSIRLNDLLNDDDDYGFAEEATEASLREYEADEPFHPTAITEPLQMLIEERRGGDEPGAPSSCPSSLSTPTTMTTAGNQKAARSMRMHEDFDGGLLYSSRDRLDELAGLSPGSSAAAKEGEKGERISLGGLSVGSHDSREGGNKSSSDSSGQPAGKEGKSKGIGALIDKARHRLGGSRERSKTKEPQPVEEQAAGKKEASEMTADKTTMAAARRPSSLPIDATAASVGAAAREDTLTPMLHLITHHLTQLPFAQTRLYTGALLLAMTMAWPGFLVGLLWGMYVSGVAFLFFFVSDPREKGPEEEEGSGEMRSTAGGEEGGRTGRRNPVDEVFEQTAVAVLQQRPAQPVVVYRGWMNELPPTTRYDPSAYHVNSCRCVLVRLEGATLRISRPSRAVLKHAFHTDPTLTATPPSMVAQSIYDLTDATVSLRPRRLARLRWWSRKYPIYIRLKKEKDDEEKRAGKRRKRSEAPRMKRSISMHPSSSGIAEAAASGVERAARREGAERRAAESGHDEEEWTTATDSEWEEEEDLRAPSKVGSAAGGFTRARSSTEISGGGDREKEKEENGTHSTASTTAARRAAARKPRGIYLFARAAREKERWFHLLREACAKARIVRTRLSSDVIDGSVVRSRSTTDMGEGLDVSPPLTPAEKRKRESSVFGGVGEMDSTTAAAREFMLYRSNQAHFARSMSEAMGISLASLARVAAAGPGPGSSGSSGTSSAAAGNGAAGAGAPAAAPSTMTPAGVRAAMMTRDASLEDDTQSVNLGSVRWKPSTLPEGNADLVASVNAIAGRIFFDFCRDAYWCAQVKEKIQTKLATIHLPYFIENLELSSLDLGTTTPHIESVHAPVCDEWGLWVDFEMKYSGGIRLALETRVNLLKLQSAADEAENSEEPSASTAWAKRSNRPATRYSDEDLPESPEDSPDEDFGAKMTAEKEKTGRERAASKIVSLVESAARSSIFQKAAKLSKVAKVITDISSTRLILNVEIEAIEGTMTVNLPPPPSDRIWYAFRKRPKVSIRAIPQVGDRSVDLTTVSDWIESKLRLLIEKNLVCPNMDDIIIPAMSGNELLKMNYNR